MPGLPIEDVLPQLCASLATTPNAVLAAPPGAGKTTRVPLALLDQPWNSGRILVLEPRRLAARAAAARLAEHLGETPGQTVGYRIRGERRTSPATRIEVITEGILTRMLLADPDLPGISAVLFDEVHERSIHSDLGLALCLEVQEALRPELRLLAMSATLDTRVFSTLMSDAPVIKSAGRLHPIETHWLARPWRSPGAPRHHIARPVATLIRQALAETEGDVLAFLPGAGEIRRVETLLADCGAAIRPLYGALPDRAQRRALAPEPDGGRRVVLATSIAETSLTVPGIRVVVDAGLARRARVDPGTGLSRLVTVPVSRAEADQRRGRAGRLGPGTCYRLWTKGEEGGLPAFAPPEITEADLVPLALDLAAWGTRDPAELRFLTAPNARAFAAAREVLRGLSALDAKGVITTHGRAMAARPTHPRLAHMLLTAAGQGLEPEAALIAAALTERLPEAGTSDLVTRLTTVLIPEAGAGAARGPAERIRAEARRLCPGKPRPQRLHDHAGMLAALAFPDRIALRRPGDAPRFLLANGRGAVMDRHDPLAGQRLLVALDLEDGTEARIRLAARLDEAEVRAAFGDQIETVETAEWSSRTRRVDARRREMLGALALSDQIWHDAPPEDLGAAMAAGVRDLGLEGLPWTRPAHALRKRIRWLKAQPTPLADDLPDWSDEALLGTLDDWLTPHLAGMARKEDLRALDLTAILKGTLDWALWHRIEAATPAHFISPLGSRLLIDYGDAGPTVAARVQEFYGLGTHPTLGDTGIALRLELLSPAGRPVQTTTDLPGFWAGSYADVRKDMRARYPKHAWPEDPATAKPTRRARKPGETKS